jgi:alpha-beta hydrolase superfamily lysophospholipase
VILEVTLKHTEFLLLNDVNDQTFGREWRPDTRPLAVIVLVPGLSDHTGRYHHMAEYFTNRGVGIIALDLYGNGKSNGKRGHIPADDTYLDCIDLLIEKAQGSFINVPTFLYGHSMGGEIVLRYTLSRKPKIKGVIATAPLFVTYIPPNPLKLMLAKTMDKLYPAFSMSDGIDPKNISRDQKVVSSYISDPLVHGKVTARLGWSIIKQGKWLLEHAHEFPLPLLLMVGTGERIVDRVSIDQFAKTAPHVDYKIWDGLYHELHNEPEKEEVFDFEFNWIKKHLD